MRSNCKNGWLHRYNFKRVFEDGVEEVCEVCRDRKFFKNNGSNYQYLSYHMRSVLRPSDTRFSKEYGQHTQ